MTFYRSVFAFRDASLAMRNVFVAVVLLIACTPALAHDYYLLPETFTPEVSKPVVVRLHLGDGFTPEGEKPFAPKLASTFQLVGAKQTRDLLKELPDEVKGPAIKFNEKGTWWLRLDRLPRQITLDADKFNSYLAEEGLQTVLEQRRKDKEDKLPGRERYSRCLKCLLQVDNVRDDTTTNPLGQKLEIVPQAHPGMVAKGKTLAVKVLFDGTALPEVAVTAYRREGEKVHKQALRTDKDGVAKVQLDAGGVWLVRLVHMVRCADRKEADWESYWSALTFSVP